MNTNLIVALVLLAILIILIVLVGVRIAKKQQEGVVETYGGYNGDDIEDQHHTYVTAGIADREIQRWADDKASLQDAIRGDVTPNSRVYLPRGKGLPQDPALKYDTIRSMEYREEAPGYEADCPSCDEHYEVPSSKTAAQRGLSASQKMANAEIDNADLINQQYYIRDKVWQGMVSPDAGTL